MSTTAEQTTLSFRASHLFLGISKDDLRKIVDQGKLTAIKDASNIESWMHWTFSKASLEAFKAACK